MAINISPAELSQQPSGKSAECMCEGSGLGLQFSPARRHHARPVPRSLGRRALKNVCAWARASPPALLLFFFEAVVARQSIHRALSAQAPLEPVSSCWGAWEGAGVLSPAPRLGPCPVAAGHPASPLRRCLGRQDALSRSRPCSPDAASQPLSQIPPRSSKL